jgi:hypothetical protein
MIVSDGAAVWMRGPEVMTSCQDIVRNLGAMCLMWRTVMHHKEQIVSDW